MNAYFGINVKGMESIIVHLDTENMYMLTLIETYSALNRIRKGVLNGHLGHTHPQKDLLQTTIGWQGGFIWVLGVLKTGNDVNVAAKKVAHAAFRTTLPALSTVVSHKCVKRICTCFGGEASKSANECRDMDKNIVRLVRNMRIRAISSPLNSILSQTPMWLFKWERRYR